MPSMRTLAATVICTGLMAASRCLAGAGIPSMDTVRVAGGGGVGGTLVRPLFTTFIPGDNTRLFIVEQRGLPNATSARIMVLDLTTSPPTLLPTPFATVTGLSTQDEQGLLGLAFDPNYMSNGRFYIYFTNASQDVLQRWTDSNTADSVYTAAGSPVTLLSWTDPESNHNGGWLAFGPDGYLYLSVGDGGGANDQHTQNCATGNGQCLTTYLGKILRFDVSGATYTSPPGNPFVGVAGNDEIWAYGLRNPWRPSFDRLTGQLYIADVGQGAWEEIDVQPANTSETIGDPGYQGGKNYGWRCMEGFNCTGLTGCTCNAAGLTLPIYNYSHASSRCSITGGYVYRGSAIPGLQGTYFFADYCGNQIYTMQYTGTPNPPITDRTAELAPGGGLSITSITSFGEDAAGELYICDRNGEVFKIIPTPPVNNTCVNATLVADGTTSFDTFAATTDGPDETNCGFGAPSQMKNDIWYKFTASCTGTGRVSLCGTTFDTRIAAYAGCPAGPGSALACNDDFCGTASEITFPVVQGTTYRVRIGTASGETGTGTMTISCQAPTPPANDSCANATVVADGSSTGFDSANATTDGPDESGCGFGAPTQIQNDVWFTFTASCTGSGKVSLCGSGFDTRVAVYATCPSGPGEVLACNDDSACGTASEVDFAVVQGTSYLVRIGSSSGRTGTGTVTVSCEKPPPPPCIPDINGSGTVDIDDLLAVINSWGPCPVKEPCPGDINSSGTVDVDDLLGVINGWGACP